MNVNIAHARVHYDAQLHSAEETRQNLLLSVRRQLEYLEAPIPADLGSWSIPALQERLSHCADRIWERQGTDLLAATLERQLLVKEFCTQRDRLAIPIYGDPDNWSIARLKEQIERCKHLAEIGFLARKGISNHVDGDLRRGTD